MPEPVVKARLRDAGIVVPNGTIDVDEAGAMQPPLVLKAFGTGIVHKSDVGAVRLGLGHDDLAAAVDDMTATLAGHGVAPDGFLVEEQAAPATEFLVGVTRTPFGLAVAVGLGGLLAELLDDVAVGLVPVDIDELLSSFRASAVLGGVRGGPPLDRAALAGVVRGLVAVAEEFGDRLLELECNPVLVGTSGAVAADARLLLATDVVPALPPPVPLDLDALLTPHTVAVVGASTSKAGFGNRALAAYRAFGWTEGLYAIHPSAPEIDGVPAVPSVADVPGGVDYLLVAVPASACAAVITAGQGHVKNAHVVSGGFGETGAADLEADLGRAARDAGVRTLGPNCIGLYAPAGRQAFQLDVPAEAGGVAVLSQSGGLGGDVVRAGAGRGLRYSCVITVGNAVDVTAGELLERLVDEPSTRVVGLYLEGTRDGERLVSALRKVRGRLPAAILVGGSSRQGQAAVTSHTGALAGDRRMWEAVARDTGATLVDDLDAFLGVLLHLDRYRDHRAGGDAGTLVVGVGGGASVLATDACDAAGLDVRHLGGDLVDELRALGYGAGTSVANPIEIPVGPAAADDAFASVLDPILGRESFDDVLLHVNVQAYYGYGTGGAAPLLRQLAALQPDRWPARLTVVLRNLDTAPAHERDAIVSASPVPAYRTFAEAAVAVAATKRFARTRRD